MKIGYRTIKTAIATPIAISIAQLLGINSIVSAGILTILCIQPSRKKSVESALQRFMACILAMIFSVVFFKLLGYHPVILGIMLSLYIPTTIFLKIEQGFLTSTVIILNLYGIGTISSAFLYEQFLLILIGIGVGLIVNLYMPSLDKDMRKKQHQLEDAFQVILREIASYIRNHNKLWDGKEITKCAEIIEEAESLVERDRENHFMKDHHSYFNYFQMRKKQFEHLESMLPLVALLTEQNEYSLQIADFFDGLADAVHPGNTAILFLDKLHLLRKEFDAKELPTTREEFETRACLYLLLHELEDYLLLKSRFKKSDIKRRPKLKRKRKAENQS